MFKNNMKKGMMGGMPVMKMGGVALKKTEVKKPTIREMDEDKVPPSYLEKSKKEKSANSLANFMVE